jgi:hypothetical protein
MDRYCPAEWTDANHEPHWCRYLADEEHDEHTCTCGAVLVLED